MAKDKPASDTAPAPADTQPADDADLDLQTVMKASPHAKAYDDAFACIIAEYGIARNSERDFNLAIGEKTAAFIDLAMTVARDQPIAEAFRAKACRLIAEDIASQYGAIVRPDEWVAAYQLHHAAKALTATADSDRISYSFLRTLRAWIGRKAEPNVDGKGYREEWSIKPGYAEHVKHAFETQAARPESAKALREWMDVIDGDRLDSAINAATDPKLRTALVAKRDAKAARQASKGAKAKPINPATLTPADAGNLATALIAANNLNAIMAMVRLFGPYVSSALTAMAPAPAPAPLINPAAAPTPHVNGAVRQVA